MWYLVQCDAKAIGSGSEGAQTTLQEEYKTDLTFKEAEVLALSTLKQVMEEKVCAAPLPHHPLADRIKCSARTPRSDC